jgi:hypothetical protein
MAKEEFPQREPGYRATADEWNLRGQVLGRLANTDYGSGLIVTENAGIRTISAVESVFLFVEADTDIKKNETKECSVLAQNVHSMFGPVNTWVDAGHTIKVTNPFEFTLYTKERFFVRLHPQSSFYIPIRPSPVVEIVRRTTSTPDANGFYEGFVQRYDANSNTWADAEACLIKDSNA